MGLTVALVSELDHVGDWGLMATDANLKLTSWNRWLELKTGIPAANAVGRSLYEVFPELISRRLDQHYLRALAGQTVILSQRFHKYIIPIETTLGGSQYARMQQTVRIVPLMENSTVCGSVTIIEDVTERVAHEEELLARTRRQTTVAALARSSLAGRNVVDMAGEVVTRVREILGVDYVEILALQSDGLNWVQLAGAGWSERPPPSFPWEAAPRTWSIGTRRTLGVEKQPDFEQTFTGDPYLIAHGVTNAMIVRIFGESDRPFGILGTYSQVRRTFALEEQQFIQAVADVLGVGIQRNRLQDELSDRVEQLAEMDRRKDEFLAMLAHELRNPLAPISNSLQGLKLKFSDRPGVESTISVMERQLDHLTRLVDDLLDVSRISSGKFELRKEWVDLAAIVNRVVDSIQPMVNTKNHRLETQFGEGQIGLEADPDRIEQILVNLLTNATKYTPPGGHIKLSIRYEGEEVVVRVTDNGIGIRPEMLPRLFNLFQQADRVPGRVSEGLGIGLSLVRTLTEMHGGSVSASSCGPGLGSEFVVRFPVGNSPFPHASSQLAAEASVQSRRVLITDDNADSAESLAELLGLLGHEVRTALDGHQALVEAARFVPEMIILDIGLPNGMDGYEVARRLRKLPGSGKAVLVAVTGFGSPADVAQAMEAGFDHHLTKPVALDALRKLLAN
jgi:signal transduction histidine kinase/CheY-like chemotaxis protein